MSTQEHLPSPAFANSLFGTKGLLTDSALSNLAATITPASLAVRASRGRWLPARHLQVVNRALVELATGQIDRLMVNMPPRHGKSELCSRWFPSWFLGTFPDKRVILTSYVASGAAKWGGRCRDILNEFGPAMFDVDVSGSTSAKDRWEINGHAGGMLTAGVGGPITGEGADILIIDDPVKNDEEAISPVIQDKHWEWWQSTAESRLEPGAGVLCIMTRWHENDLAGRLLKQAAETGENWKVLNMPAIAESDEFIDGKLFRNDGAALWPERWPLTALERKRRNSDLYWWLSLYQQRPANYGRSEWPAEYFGDHIWYQGDWPTRPSEYSYRYMALDPSKGKDAKKGDYSALIMLGVRGGKLYVDAKVARMPVSQIVDVGLNCAYDFAPHGFGIEGNAWQELIAADFIRTQQARNSAPLPIFTIDNRVNKMLRIQRLGPYLMNKQIVFRNTPDCKLLVQQLKDFPLGQHDDGPDALEMAIRLLNEATGSVSERVAGRVA